MEPLEGFYGDIFLKEITSPEEVAQPTNPLLFKTGVFEGWNNLTELQRTNRWRLWREISLV